MSVFRRTQPSDPLKPGLLSFRCNICDLVGLAEVANLDREAPSCDGCGSSVRLRAMIQILSVELFGRGLCVSEFPIRRDIVGLGFSDWEGYAVKLAEKFSYTNTFYHQEPRLDLRSPDKDLEGTMDFIIASDVFEHVAPPISIAFENVRRLLKPDGVLVLSVPYSTDNETVEHFPELHDYELLEEGDEPILKNVKKDGAEEIFDGLVFHGGDGVTLEMRLFSESSLIYNLRKAGFSQIRIYKTPDFDHGIYWRFDWSLPLSARI
jgi:SAM-dependent methyltransferase